MEISESKPNPVIEGIENGVRLDEVTGSIITSLIEANDDILGSLIVMRSGVVIQSGDGDEVVSSSLSSLIATPFNEVGVSITSLLFCICSAVLL